jgi:hypothetical protein
VEIYSVGIEVVLLTLRFVCRILPSARNSTYAVGGTASSYTNAQNGCLHIQLSLLNSFEYSYLTASHLRPLNRTNYYVIQGNLLSGVNQKFSLCSLALLDQSPIYQSVFVFA